MTAATILSSSFFIALLGLSSPVVAGLDEDTALLARCEGAYLYLAQVHQMADQPGMAANILSRAALVTASNMFLNQVSGKVPGARVDFMKHSREGLKEAFDGDLTLARAMAQQCDEVAKDALRSAMKGSRDKKLFGKNLPDLQSFLLDRYKQQLGL